MTPIERAAELRSQAVAALLSASEAPPGPVQRRLIAECERLNDHADATLRAALRPQLPSARNSPDHQIVL